MGRKSDRTDRANGSPGHAPAEDGQPQARGLIDEIAGPRVNRSLVRTESSRPPDLARRVRHSTIP